MVFNPFFKPIGQETVVRVGGKEHWPGEDDLRESNNYQPNEICLAEMQYRRSDTGPGKHRTRGRDVRPRKLNTGESDVGSG